MSLPELVPDALLHLPKTPGAGRAGNILIGNFFRHFLAGSTFIRLSKKQAANYFFPGYAKIYSAKRLVDAARNTTSNRNITGDFL